VNLNKHTLRGAASAVVALAAYLVGVLPADSGLGDVTVVQWLGAIVFLGASYGITAKASKDTTE
jgi:hypothetical protein